MGNTQLLINQVQDDSTQGSLSTAYKYAEEDSNITVEMFGLKVSFLAIELCKLSRQLQLSEFK